MQSIQIANGLLLLLAAGCAHAVEMHIEFGALERLLGETVFTQEGRRYVKGTRQNKCNFAYLERPRVHGDDGRLRMRAHFTGSSALNFMGQCVGVGDAFDVAITAVPVYKSGAIVLQEVKVVSEGRSGYYIKKVCAAMQSTLLHDFKYPLERDAQALLENPLYHPQYKREVKKFSVPEVRVTEDALVLVVDFEITIK